MFLSDWFDKGWNDGLAGLWLPPDGTGARLAYRDGWQQARDELLLATVL